MSDATQFLVDQQLSRYRSELAHWAGVVELMRTPLEAFRKAAQRPHPGALIASLSSLTASDRLRADQRVELTLLGHVEKGLDPRQLPDLLRLAQGHWPRIHRRLEAIQRQGGAVEADGHGGQGSLASHPAAAPDDPSP